MDDSTARLLWVFGVSAVVVLMLLVTVAGAFAWYHRQAARQARSWGRHLLAAQDAERRRIAGELHDHLVPAVWAVRLGLSQSGHGLAGDGLDRVMGDLRAVAHRLHPPALTHLSIGAALRELVAEQFAEGSPAVVVDVDDGIDVDAPKRLALFRVAQEGLTNVRKHARASRAQVRLFRDNGEVVLEISDDGVGVSPRMGASDSFGIRSMRERVALMGGTLSVVPRGGRGTRLTASVAE